MKLFMFAVVSTVVVCTDSKKEDVTKVIDLLSELHANITAEGVEAQRLFDIHREWCQMEKNDLKNTVQEASAQVASLQAVLIELDASSHSEQSKIDQLVTSVTTAKNVLNEAAQIRLHQNKDFEDSEKDMTEVIDTLTRAIAIFEKDAKDGTSMMQLHNVGSVLQALTMMVHASSISSVDGERLFALVQHGIGSPEAAVFKGHGSSLVEVLADLLEKVEGQLADIREHETTELQQFHLLKQSLEDQMKLDETNLAAARHSLEATQARKVLNGARLKSLDADNALDSVCLSDAEEECLTSTNEFEMASRSRAAELETISKARQMLQEKMVGRSFLQLMQSIDSTGDDVLKLEVVTKIRELAKSQQSFELAELAAEISNALHSTREVVHDPFAKVKGFIVDVISKLEDKATAEFSHKSFCDKLAKSQAKHTMASEDGENHSAKEVERLQREVAELQEVLIHLASSQAALKKIRSDENVAFNKHEQELEDGLAGVQKAMIILEEYYASEQEHETAEDSAEGIIDQLKEIEGDFEDDLELISYEEEHAERKYKKQLREHEAEQKQKEEEVAYKIKEAGDLTKQVTSLSEGEQCFRVPQTYQERKIRRDAEISGLKESLSILHGGNALMQPSTSGTASVSLVDAREALPRQNSKSFLRRISRH